MYSVIRVRGVSVKFIQSRHETDGAFDLFEVTLPPDQSLFMPHFHREYDETIFGMDGIATWTVDGKKTLVGPGNHLFVPRGAVHSWSNDHASTLRILCLLTPGLVGPEYFRELAAVTSLHEPPNLAEIGTVMARYGIVPATH
jgi:quercetin dioxygenase-like cupin family protein